MRRAVIVVSLAATLFLSGLPARAYTLQYTDSSNLIPLRWSSRRIKVWLSNSLSAPQSNVKPGSDVAGAVRRALARWAGAASIRFDVNSSGLQSISAPGTRGDGVSLITIAHSAENSAAFAGEGADAPGRTRVFSTVGGNISEADIVLNPALQFSTDGTPGTYDLEAAFTHEIGHLLGLEHSAVLGATMQPRQAKNGTFNQRTLSPRTLSDDDVAGVRALYGTRSTSLGSIYGTVAFASGAPVFGANVWAEEVTTGRVVASSITLPTGAYRMEGLQPGQYRVMAQPLGGMVNAAELAAPRGAYAGLAMNQASAFRAEEIGRVSVAGDEASQLNAQLSGTRALITPSLIGVDGELSSAAVPLAPGRNYKLYVAGEGVNAARLAEGGVTTSSPYIVVDPASVAQVEFGRGLSVVSFDVTVDIEAEAGDYSIRLQSLAGEVAYVAGGVTIETPDSLARAERGPDTQPEAEAQSESDGFDLDPGVLAEVYTSLALTSGLEDLGEQGASAAYSDGAEKALTAEPEK